MNQRVKTSALTLHRFQDAFAHALADIDGEEPLPPQVARIAAQPGFAVYRNTVMKGCIDALQAHHPAVSRLVGNTWFRAAPIQYVRSRRPAGPVLADYCDAFPQFLADFQPAADMRYLADVARVEQLWGQSLRAADATAACGADFVELAPAAMASMVLLPHASARWAWFAHAPVVTIWQRNHHVGDDRDAAGEPEIVWNGEGMLFTRPLDTVRCSTMDPAAIAFMDTCAAQGTLVDAAAAATNADASADLSALFARLLAAQAFASPTIYAVPSKDHSR